MDMCSKVFSLVLNTCAFLLLKKHGARFQFSGTPDVGCRDGLFTLKVLINARQNQDLPSYVGFIDLVEAYNTANHSLLLCILEQYGTPPKFVAAIKTIYRDNIAVLKIEKEVVEIPQTVGVRQGNNMAPVLFLFLMTAFAETLKIVWKQQGIPILNVMTTADDKLNEGRICSHTPAMFLLKSLNAYEILQCLYVDNIGILFGTQKRPPARNGTNISSFCPIWTGDAHRSRQNSIQDQMRLLPPPLNSSNTNSPERKPP